MANIHAINAQGTEYGLEAENGITQEQLDAIATIGDVADLETTEKTTLVGAVNEVNGKFQRETVLYENPNPTAGQDSQNVNVSGLTTAKALKITYGTYTAGYGALKEEVFPLQQNVGNEFRLSQSMYNVPPQELEIDTRIVTINANRTRIAIQEGQICTYNIGSSTASAVASETVAKVIKITALF